MKKALLALTLLLGTFFANAQTKVAYIDIQGLVSMMPLKDTVTAKLEVFRSQWLEELDAKKKEIQEKYNQLVSLPQTTSPKIIELRQTELQNLQQKYEETAQNAENDMAVKEQELFKPVLAKALKAIEDVAKAKGYDYVFDSGAAMNALYQDMLYSNPNHDLMAAVKVKLGIPASAKPESDSTLK